MARIVYVTNGMASTVYSSLELSRRLTETGHSVKYLSHLDLRDQVEAHGFDFHRLNGCQEIRNEYAARLNSSGSRWSPQRWAAHIFLGRYYRQRSLDCTELTDLVTELNPDLLIIDIEMHYAVIALLKLGIPIVLPIVWFSIFYSPLLPPLHTSIMPDQKAEIGIAWKELFRNRRLSQLAEKFRWKHLRRNLKPVSYDTNRRIDLQNLASVRQVDFEQETDRNHWLKPHLYPNLTVMSLNAMEMEFPHELHSKIRYVGPMIRRQRNESPVTSQNQNRWASFRERCHHQDQAIIYCSLGTFWKTDENFLQKVIQIFEQRNDWALVIGLGGKLSEGQLSSLPENVLAMEYAPQLDVLKSSAAAITHGGITTINECILFEVPMLVCSTGHVDQNGCQARVEYHQLGRSADINLDSTARIESQLEIVISDSKLREQIVKMKQNFARYENERVAEKLLEGMIRQNPS